jgi:DNA/RNA-binding domain of Phe-tRNA-synthetase-like protein
MAKSQKALVIHQFLDHVEDKYTKETMKYLRNDFEKFKKIKNLENAFDFEEVRRQEKEKAKKEIVKKFDVFITKECTDNPHLTKFGKTKLKEISKQFDDKCSNEQILKKSKKRRKLNNEKKKQLGKRQN